MEFKIKTKNLKTVLPTVKKVMGSRTQVLILSGVLLTATKNELLIEATDLETTLEIFELAKKNNKKAGDSCQSEFEEILKKKPEKFTYIGKTNQDIDMLTGNLREKGLKILNIKEEERRNK